MLSLEIKSIAENTMLATMLKVWRVGFVGVAVRQAPKVQKPICRHALDKKESRKSSPAYV